MTTAKCLKMVMVGLCAGALLPAMSHGGWVLRDQDGSATYIEEGKIKQVEEESGSTAIILDYNADRVVLIDAERAVYAAGTLDEYCAVMQKVMAAFGELEEALGTSEDAGQPSVEIIAGDSETIAGLESRKYSVMVDGETYEEVWMTSDRDLLADLGDIDRHRSFMECLDAGDGPVEGSQAYRQLNTKGWELRSISYDFGEEEYNSDTISIDRQPLGAEVFTPPASSAQMSFEEFFAAFAQ